VEEVILCKAQYRHGNLVYVVTIVKAKSDVDWETECEIMEDRYFVEYIEETLPSKNRVGGFKSLDEALEWTSSQFGELNWFYFE